MWPPGWQAFLVVLLVGSSAAQIGKGGIPEDKDFLAGGRTTHSPTRDLAYEDTIKKTPEPISYPVTSGKGCDSEESGEDQDCSTEEEDHDESLQESDKETDGSGTNKKKDCEEGFRTDFPLDAATTEEEIEEKESTVLVVTRTQRSTSNSTQSIQQTRHSNDAHPQSTLIYPITTTRRPSSTTKETKILSTLPGTDHGKVTKASSPCYFEQPTFNISVQPKAIAEDVDSVLLCEVTLIAAVPASTLFRVSWIYLKGSCKKDDDNECGDTLNTAVLRSTGIRNTSYTLTHVLPGIEQDDDGSYICQADIQRCPSSSGHVKATARSTSRPIRIQTYPRSTFYVGIVFAVVSAVSGLIAAAIIIKRQHTLNLKNRIHRSLSQCLRPNQRSYKVTI